MCSLVLAAFLPSDAAWDALENVFGLKDSEADRNERLRIGKRKLAAGILDTRGAREVKDGRRDPEHARR